MARPPFLTQTQREARQQLVNSAPRVEDHAGVREVGVALEFSDPEGKQHPSPRAVAYAAQSHAYFEFGCPMQDCQDGGFDANADLQPALAKRRNGHTGVLNCHGVRPRSGFKNAQCNIALTYTLAIRAKAMVTA